MYKLLIIILLVALLAAAAAAELLGRKPCVAVYYGPATPEALEKLQKVDVAIVSPLLPRATLKALHARGVTVLGYVSLTTQGGWEPWSLPHPPRVASNPEWNETIVDPCSPVWREAILSGAAGYLLNRGFNGFFLDNLDMVDRYPWMKQCIVSLVAELRKRYPAAVIAVNRGFTLIDEIAPYINILVVEGFPAVYDQAAGRPRLLSMEELAWILPRIRHAEGLARKHGFTIVFLGYTNGDPRIEKKACRLLHDMGLGSHPVYYAPWPLQELGRCNPCRG